MNRFWLEAGVEDPGGGAVAGRRRGTKDIPSALGTLHPV